MRRFVFFLVIMVIAVGLAVPAMAAGVRMGIQQNLPVYAQVLGADRVSQLLALVRQGEITYSVVPKGTIGDNYWVDEYGSLHVIQNYILPYDRPARVVDGEFFFTTCDNLFIPVPRPRAVIPPTPIVQLPPTSPPVINNITVINQQPLILPYVGSPGPTTVVSSYGIGAIQTAPTSNVSATGGNATATGGAGGAGGSASSASSSSASSSSSAAAAAAAGQ